MRFYSFFVATSLSLVSAQSNFEKNSSVPDLAQRLTLPDTDLVIEIRVIIQQAQDPSTYQSPSQDYTLVNYPSSVNNTLIPPVSCTETQSTYETGLPSPGTATDVLQASTGNSSVSPTALQISSSTDSFWLFILESLSQERTPQTSLYDSTTSVPIATLVATSENLSTTAISGFQEIPTTLSEILVPISSPTATGYLNGSALNNVSTTFGVA